MEVVVSNGPTNSNGSPFHNHDVREWSRLDSISGVLECARLETDHWTANTATTSHKYNKVVDSRARSNADGNLQQQARRKLEVFQSQVPDGHIQVIKSHTSVSSSSRWSSTTTTEAVPTDKTDNLTGDFADLKLSFNPLNLTSEKSKARVGRSVGRRPPSRSHIRDNLHTTAAVNLHRVSRLCHQIHNTAVRQSFGTFNNSNISSNDHGVEITELEDAKPILARTKSTSSEDLSQKSLEDLNDLEELQNWRRSSKVRRSLQYKSKNEVPKVSDLPIVAGSVRKIREELETGRRLSTALRGNANVDLEALDNILKSISNSSISSASHEEVEIKAKKCATPKRNSFVTVESIQAVKDRLRRSTSPSLVLDDDKNKENLEDDDDGIVSDGKSVNLEQITRMSAQRKKQFVNGLEGKGTGSLESKSKLVNGKSEDWYARRKSYGFEQMHQQNAEVLGKNKRLESSTDSGICRSTETVPAISKYSDFDFDINSNVGNVKKVAQIFENLKSPNPKATKDESSKRLTSTCEDLKFPEIATDNLDEIKGNKSGKKVEFCKTEVHFAADSGRVNIVETDEKPPPTQNFRRRRRNSGPYAELLAKSNLPVLHFGDTTYEKSLFGEKENIYENIDLENKINNVTVNAPQNFQKDFFRDAINDTEAPRGILKNKPVKPKPYLLGIDKENDWNSDQIPIWNSTVTLSSNVYDQNEEREDKEEFQKLLTQLRPTSRRLSPTLLKRKSESNFDNFDVPSPTPNRRSSWSVADRVKQVEDLSWNSSKGYLTKVNFGNGEATVVESPNGSKWYRNDDSNEEGRTEKHTVCSKTMTNSDTNETMTTTKITIDLTPSPTSTADFKFPTGAPPVIRTEFKSPSLIMKLDSGPKLDALRKLYEDVHSDSEADKEVHRILMNSERDSDSNSVLSGSWSKMTAFKHNNSSFNTISTSHTNGSHALELKKESSPIFNSQFLRGNEQLSSPLLVGRRSRNNSANSDADSDNSYQFRTKSTPHMQILRQPKKSEMAYFGIKLPEDKLDNKNNKKKLKDTTPDLLKFNSKINKSVEPKVRKTSPLYENEKNFERKNYYNRSAEKNFDSSILDELTKAADQILQAVNNFEDDKSGTDDEFRRRRNEKLDTISETNTWKKSAAINKSPLYSSNQKLKSASSNSSLDSISRECRRSRNHQERPFMTKSAELKQRKKVESSSSSSSKISAVKARRLQRASSREALLQSHGSSSEDLSAHVVEVKKPTRLIKRTKTQFTVTNGLEIKKPLSKVNKKEERNNFERTTNALPEIRHKTAVSTIRSTAEKAALKRTTRNEEIKRRQILNSNLTSNTLKGNRIDSVVKPTENISRGKSASKGVLSNSSRHSASVSQQQKRTSKGHETPNKHK